MPISIDYSKQALQSLRGDSLSNTIAFEEGAIDWATSISRPEKWEWEEVSGNPYDAEPMILFSPSGWWFDCHAHREDALRWWGYCPETEPPVTAESIAADVEKMKRILRP
jgi:hypothetical protein